ncbi:unnamed protein product [Closterium sp. Naga37s-1]|nr:unnamed protein product [Closterium sp. Naga37s-1]
MASDHEIPLLPSPSSRLSPSSRAPPTNVAGDSSRNSRFRRLTAWVSFTIAAALLLLLLELEILPLPSYRSHSYTSESDVAHSPPLEPSEPRNLESELASLANAYGSGFVRSERFRDGESASSESEKSAEEWRKRVAQLPRLRAEQRRVRKAQRHGGKAFESTQMHGGKPPGDGAGGSGGGGVGLRLWPMPAEIAAEGSGEVVVSPNLRLDISFGGVPSLVDGRRRKANAEVLRRAFERYLGIIFAHDYSRRRGGQSHGGSERRRLRGRNAAEGGWTAEAEGEETGLKGAETGVAESVAKGEGEELEEGEKGVEVMEWLHMGVDESYELSLPLAPPPPHDASHAAHAARDSDDADAGNTHARHGHATIWANTTTGALRALETLSQLCVFDFLARVVTIRGSPLLIRDAPRFQHRGLLIDTARHFLPVVVMERVIDSMAYAKLNVLHWHMVDSQSFPIETPSFPRLWLGAFSLSERYTTDDMRYIVQYAEDRGVMVVPELDSPAHAASWGVGYPSLLPSAACPEPLDVFNPLTFQLIKGVLQDLRAVFKSSYIHLGGDEVSFECWKSSPTIIAWLQQRNLTAEGGYGYFVRRVQALAVEAGWQTAVVWEEPFKVFGADLDPATTIVQNWFDTTLPPAIVQSGFRMFFSNLNLGWYLDFVDRTWSEVYSQEPTAGVPEALQHLVVGGETCMWGERVDPSDLLNTVWPRAAAAAGVHAPAHVPLPAHIPPFLPSLSVPISLSVYSERLWSPQAYVDPHLSQAHTRLHMFRCLLTSSFPPVSLSPHSERLWSPRAYTDSRLSQAHTRLHMFRCLLTSRGIEAAPVDNAHVRSEAPMPGSCYRQ